MGKSLDRGQVLVLSLWDDKLTNMNWLDSKTGSNKGGDRGPCSRTSGAPDNVRAKYPNAYATYTNIMYGEIGSTYTAGPSAKPENHATGNTAYAKALKAYSEPPPSMQQPQQPQMQQPQQQQQQSQQPQLQQPQQQSQPLSSSGCAIAWGQCGGHGWGGATCCEQGCTCTASGGYYSQCKPPAGVNSGCQAPGAGGFAMTIMKKDSEDEPIREAGLSHVRREPSTIVALLAFSAIPCIAAVALMRGGRLHTMVASASARLAPLHQVTPSNIDGSIRPLVSGAGQSNVDDRTGCDASP